MKFDNVLTESEKARIAKKKAPEEQFEGYGDDVDFAGLESDDDYNQQFGHDQGDEPEPELQQNIEPVKQQKDKPYFDDGIDAAAYYAGQGLRWTALSLWDTIKQVGKVLGEDKIVTYRLVFINVFFLIVLLIGDAIAGKMPGAFAFRPNMLIAFGLGIFYLILSVIKGGPSQIMLNRDDLLEIFGRGTGSGNPGHDESEDADSYLEDDSQDYNEEDEDDEVVFLEEEDTSTAEDDFDFGSFSDEDLNFDFSATEFSDEGASEELEEQESEQVSAPKPKLEVEQDGRLSRKRLFEIMKELLPTKTPGYANIIEHSDDSDDFANWEGMMLKALSSATKKALEDVDSELVYVKENTMTVFLEMTRIHGFTNTAKIKEEIEAFVSAGNADSGVSVKVELAGNNYKITILKDVRPIIFLKDAMLTPKVEQFLTSTSKVMPVVVGIDEYANPELIDMVGMESCITTGMARSGKSKSLTSKFGQMCCLNTPQDVQFVIFDPKRSELLKAMSLMPHVAGLHNMETGLEALRDIVEKEAEYRKKLLEKNRVNNIAGFNKKFPKNKLPYIWIIADEIMTIKEEFTNQKTKDSDPWKEFLSLLTIIFTQLPYVGIKMWGISHRVQSVLSPNLVMNLFYKESIRGSAKLVEELLGKDETPETKLKYPGDSALWYAGSKGKFVKSFLVCFDEEDEKKGSVPDHEQEGYFWREMARAFYDIGFDYPERKRYGVAFNRPSDEEVREEIDNDGSAPPVGFDDDLEPDFDMDDD